MTIFTDGPRIQPAGMTLDDLGPVSFGEYLGATARAAFSELPTVKAKGIRELGDALGDRPSELDLMDAGTRAEFEQAFRQVVPGYKPASEIRDVPIAEARERVKSEGFDKHLTLPAQDSIKEPALDIMLTRARERREREAIIARGPDPYYLGSALSLGTSFLVGAIDPLNLAAFSIPVIGELRYAKLLADAGEGVMARAGMRALQGGASGAVGTVPLAALDWRAMTQEGRDDTMAHALHSAMMNIGLGAFLHTSFGAGADVYRGIRGRPVYPFAEGEPFAPARPSAADGAVRPDTSSPGSPPAREITPGVDEGAAAPELTHALPAAEARDAVRADVFAQLKASGMTDAEAASNAAVVSARYAARAERLGESDAHALYAAEGLAVGRRAEMRGEGIEGRAFDQPAPPTWAEIVKALPKGEDGKPDMGRAFALIEEIGGGKQKYSDLSSRERIEMQRRLSEPERTSSPDDLFSDPSLLMLGEKLVKRAWSGLKRTAGHKSFFQRERLAPPFYSAVLRSVEGAKQEKAPAAQWLGTLKNTPGVKPEELEWLDLEAWLKEQKGPVSKQATADYVRANSIELKEVTKYQERPTGGNIVERTRTNPDALQAELVDAGLGESEARELVGKIAAGRVDAADQAALLISRAGGRMTKFGSYALPGGENYRELLLTLPAKVNPLEAAEQRYAAILRKFEREGAITEAEQREWDALSTQVADLRRQGHPHDSGDQNYRSSHWDEPNVLAHVRFNDRTIDGKKTLFLEEIQSDWHQAGKRKGYETEEASAQRQKAITEASDRLADVRARRDQVIGDAVEFVSIRAPDWVPVWNSRGQGKVDKDNVALTLGKIKGESGRAHPDSQVRGAAAEQLERIRAATEDVRTVEGDVRDAQHKATAPDAPFKTTWPELALKRMIRYAAEHGYEQVGWTSGKTQAARYDLSKQVERLYFRRNDDATFLLRAELPDGSTHSLGERIPQAQLPDHIGKDAADRILEKFEKYPNADPDGSLAGPDLKVGGEGMAGFYDKMLPAAANKLAKKYGGKVEQGQLDKAQEFLAEIGAKAPIEGEPVHTLTIPPAMREAALKEGFPLFQKGAEGAPQGRITLAEHKAVVELFARADRSTFMHEMGHKWLDELARDSSRANVPQALKDDLGTVLRWLGVDKAEDIATFHHEKWARAFEQYLMEGKAPSTALARAFDNFKRWLTQIYRSLAEIGTPITDDIRGVMDRMLATDAELARRPVMDAIADLPPRAKEDAMRAAVAALIEGKPVQVGEMLQAAAQSDPRIAESLEIAVRKPVPRGPRARDPEHWSLLEFIASRGGIDPQDALIGDVRSLIGTSNKFVPGFGHLIRKDGMRLDTMREAAVEAGYLQDAGFRDSSRQATSTINTLFEAMDRELRGERVYRQGVEPPLSKAERARRDEDNEVAAERSFDDALDEVGIRPNEVTDKVRARVVEMLLREHERDPLAAFERAVMEQTEHGAQAGEHDRIADHIPGWDVPDDAGAASRAGRAAAPGGQDRAGGPARAAGEGDRGAQLERGWRELAGRGSELDDPATIAASKTAEALAEPASLKATDRLQAAEKALAEAEQLYKDAEAYLPADLRERVEDAVAARKLEGEDRAQVIRQGAACLAAAVGGAL